MPVNQFLTFAGDPAANVMPIGDYGAPSFTTRLVGFATGTAISAELNRVWRGASLITSMIGQFTVDRTGRDMLDDGTPAGMSALQLNFDDAVKRAAIEAVGTGFVPLAGGTMTGPLVVQAPVGIHAPIGQAAVLGFTRSTNQAAQIISGTGTNVPRWLLNIASADPETGGNAGSNFAINRYADNGAYLDTPMAIDRATGIVRFAHPPQYAQGALPYLPLTGGTLTGMLQLAGAGNNGINYAPFGGNYHAFGWDGPSGVVNAYVDGTWVGTIATRGWVSGLVGGAYLPLAGGTITGNLTVRGGLYGTTGSFSSNVSFANLGDFVNFSGGNTRYRQWAGNWWDGWDGSNGNRWWYTASGRAMTLSGNADLYVQGTLRSQGGRTMTTENGQNFSPSCGLWNIANGIAMGMWLDPGALQFGNLDGSGNPSRGLFAIQNDGTVAVANNLWIANTIWMANVSASNQVWAGNYIASGGDIRANGTLFAGWDVNAGHVVYAPTFSASNNIWAQNAIQCSNWGSFGTNLDVYQDLHVHRNSVTDGDDYANRQIANGDILALNGWIYSAWNGAGTIMSDRGIHYLYDHGISFSFRWDGKYFFRQINGGEREVIEGSNGQVRFLDMQNSYLHWFDGSGYSWYANTFLSDTKFKRDVKDAEEFDSLAALTSLPIRAYDWREGWPQHHVPHGFLADEVRALLPDAVISADGIEEAEGQTTDFLDPIALIAHLVRAVRQLNNIVKELQHA